MRPYYEDERAGIALYHGEACAVLASLPEASCDVLLTDPPYSSGGMFRSDRGSDPAQKYRGWSQNSDGSRRAPTAEYGTFGGDSRDQRSWLCWVGAWSWAALRATKPGGHGFLFSDWRQLPTATDAAQLGGWVWRGINVWDKGTGRPFKGRFRNHLEYVVWMTNGPIEQTDAYPSALISVPTVAHGEREHVTQKPVALLQQLLCIVPGDRLTVLDPFMGVGSVIIAARNLGHRCVGIEIEERYCEATARRLQQEILPLHVEPMTRPAEPHPTLALEEVA